MKSDKKPSLKTKIIDYGYNCEGVGKYDGKVVFVPFSLKGEEVEFLPAKVTSSFIKAKLVSVTNPSPKRINPPCKYFGRCGGCKLQNIGLADEMSIKQEIAEKHFAKLGYSGAIECIAINDYFYRNKIKLFCDKNGLGLKEAASNNIVSIDSCIISNNRINEIINCCQTFIKAQKLENKLDTLLIRTEGQHALIHFNFKEKFDLDFQGLQIMLGSGSGIFCSIKGGQPKHIIGAETLAENLFGIKINYSVSTFKQVNDQVAQNLYQKVLDNILGDEVINAYSGAGLLTAIIAKQGKKCIGIEIGESEHQDAQKLKEENNLKKMLNFKGDCGKILPQIITKSISTIIVDPARAGCDEAVINAINSSNARRVIYISCNIPTQVRDLQKLSNYNISSISIFNMFPKTAKVESLVILDKKKLSKNLQEKLERDIL